MSLVTFITFCIAGLGVYSIIVDREVIYFRELLETTIKRSSLNISIGSGKDKHIELPKILKSIKKPYGWYVILNLPIGVTIEDAIKSRIKLESATNSSIEMWNEGQILHMKFYLKNIPKTIKYNDKYLPTESLKILIGFSKRGREILDYLKMPNPNVLIGGMAGLGKSNLVNVILTQLIDKGNTELYLIDPKRVEFNIYSNIPNVKEIAKDTLTAKQVAREVARIANERSEIFDSKGYTNIHIYNEHEEEKLPYVFLVIDEFGDFAGKKFEDFWDDVGEIARKGRALGCYLILSTQRPDNTVLDQQVKANIGTKISFKTSNQYNSEIILGKGNTQAVLLPMRSGRCFMDDGMGVWEMQVPHLSREQHEAVLSKYKVVRQHEGYLKAL